MTKKKGKTNGPKRAKWPTASLAVFAWGGLEPETHQCIVRDIKQWPNLAHLIVTNDALIDRSRSRAASDFIHASRDMAGDVLLMVDHDIIWNEGDLQRIADKAREVRGVVGGIYPKRTFGKGVPVRFAEAGDHTVGEDRLVHARYVSTGFMAIHIDVLTTLAEKQKKTLGDFWPFFIPALAESDKGDVEYLSEDWAMCERARQAGFPVYADLKPRLKHIGRWAYRVVDAVTGVKPDVPITLEVNAETHSKVLATLHWDVCEYLEQGKDAFLGLVSDARTALATSWHANGGFDKEEEWYRRQDVGMLYLLDLAGWHTGTELRNIDKLTGDWSGLRILDFGAGIGTHALIFAEGGADVDTVEINDELNEFAAHRAEKLGLKLNQVAAPTGQYDVVGCWHVLEHVADPQGIANMLVAHLKPGGRLMTDSDFVADDLHPMHHEGVDPTDIWRAAGLVPVEGASAWYEKPEHDTIE